MSQYITIPGFEELTPQQIVDMAEEHVRGTGRKSEKKGVCVYSGTGCAASVFIKARSRRKADALDETGWSYLEEDGLVPGTNAALVVDIQSAHDHADSRDFLPQFIANMADVREKYGLAPYTPKAG